MQNRAILCILARTAVCHWQHLDVMVMWALVRGEGGGSNFKPLVEGLNPPTTSPLATGLALPRGSDSVRSASFQIFAFRTLLHSAGGITLGISRGGGISRGQCLHGCYLVYNHIRHAAQP